MSWNYVHFPKARNLTTTFCSLLQVGSIFSGGAALFCLYLVLLASMSHFTIHSWIFMHPLKLWCTVPKWRHFPTQLKCKTWINKKTFLPSIHITCEKTKSQHYCRSWSCKITLVNWSIVCWSFSDDGSIVSTERHYPAHLSMVKIHEV